MLLPRVAIRRPVATLMFYCGVVFLGFVSLRHLSIDLLPDISFPRLSVVTSCPGSAAEEVESLITAPLEAAVSGIPGLRRVESVSKEGVSFLSLEFNWGIDMDMTLLHTREKLDSIRANLPEEAENPTIVSVDPQSQPVLIIAILAKAPLFEVRQLAEELIKPRLEQIEGIGSAEIVGGVEREIKVEVNPQLLTLYGLTLDEVARRIDAFNRNLQGGIIRKGQFKYALRVVGEFEALDEINLTPLKTTSERSVVRLRDIANVVDSFKEKQGAVSLNGTETVGLLLRKEAGANTVKVTRLVRQVIKELEKEFPEISLVIVTEEARTIEQSIQSVEKEIVLGGLLAFLIFFLFLQELGTSLIIFAVIATSVIATFNLLFIRSISLNLMSLGGLALGVGMLDDCAIVVTENIFRHRSLGRKWPEAAAVGTSEVGMALAASIFTTIAVFLPVIYIHGVAGQLFRDQALTVTFSLLASLLVALTLIPMLASRPWTKERESGGKSLGPLGIFLGQKFPVFPSRKQVILVWPFLRWLIWLILAGSLFLIGRILSFLGKKVYLAFLFLSRPLRRLLRVVFRLFNQSFSRFSSFYQRSLVWSLNHKSRISVASVAAFIVVILIGLHLPQELVPELKVASAEIRLNTPVEFSFEQTLSLVQNFEQRLLREPAVKQVFSQSGIVSGLEAFSPEISLNSARILFQTKRAEDLERVLQKIRSWSLRFPEVDFSFFREKSTLAQWIGMDVSELGVRVYGENLEVLRQEAQDFARKLKSLPGVITATPAIVEGKPEFLLHLIQEAIEANNISPEALSAFIVQAVRGRVATSFKEVNRKYDITIRANEETRRDIETLLNLTFPSSSSLIPLRSLVKYELARGPGEIRRENQQRMVEIKLGLRGRRPGQIIPEIQKMAADLNPQRGLRVGFGKEAEEMRLSFRSLFLAFILSVILVYMIMAAQFESLLHPFLIMFTVPMGLGGSILLLALTGQTINLLSLIGIVISVGIVVNNAIVEIDMINQLRRQGSKLHEAILQGCSLRLRPILMSSLSTVFGLVPLSMGLGGGSDLEKPLGLSITGGLLFSTFLTLVLIPCLYEAVEKRRSEPKL